MDLRIGGQVIQNIHIEAPYLIHKYGNAFTTQTHKNIARDALEPYFAQCDAVFRTGKSSLSAIAKAAEISIFIFLRIFSNDGLDRDFKEENGVSVWECIRRGNTSIVNKIFKDFLNRQYENVFPSELIKVDSRRTRELAKIIDVMFVKCNIDRMTDVKGNALEYYQKDSKDKKIGEFFTPRHLIELMIALVKPEIKFKKDDSGHYMTDQNGNRMIESVEKIYDPACGSGGFLITTFLTYKKKYKKYGVTEEDLRKNVIFGNELKDTTVMLTKLNMILLGDGHNHISNENALGYEKIPKLEFEKDQQGRHIEVDATGVEWKMFHVGSGTRSMPYEKDTGMPVIATGKKEHKFWRAHIKLQPDGIREMVDYVNVKPVNDKVYEYHKDFFGKFDIVMANHPYAIPEPNQPDELFVKHMLESVRKGGRIACIVGETLLFHRTYAAFRKWMLENYTVEAIISLPRGVFNPYTDVKTSILLLSKEKAPENHRTWLVDLQHDGYDLNLRRNPISENDIPKVKRLWEHWGGYSVEDENGTEMIKSYHKEELGFAEFHKLDKSNWCVKRYNTPSISVGTKKQFMINKGQFLISKIDARNGAYGIVPKELDGAIITGNFWTHLIILRFPFRRLRNKKKFCKE